MRVNGILNSDICKLVSDLGHGDSVTICDCAYPIPKEALKVDVALKFGMPTVLDVLEMLDKELYTEKIIVAQELLEEKVDLIEKYKQVSSEQCTFINHETFKEEAKASKLYIRTGDTQAYSNIILYSGAFLGGENDN